MLYLFSLDIDINIYAAIPLLLLESAHLQTVALNDQTGSVKNFSIAVIT